MGIMQHDLAVDGACHQCDRSRGVRVAQCTQQRKHADHVAKLIVLTHNEDVLNRVVVRYWPDDFESMEDLGVMSSKSASLTSWNGGVD